MVETRKFLVPVDCDARSVRLVKWASDFARRFDAELILVHIYEQKPYAPAHTTPWQFVEMNKALREAAEARMDRFRHELAAQGISVAQGVVKIGYVIEEVPRAAEELGADLIVVSTHCYSLLRHLMLGSKAEGILHGSTCPVLVIPRFV